MENPAPDQCCHRFQLLVEAANEAIVVVQDGLIAYFNPKSLEMSGHRPEQLQNLPFREFVHPLDRELVNKRYRDRLRGLKVPSTYQFRIIDAHGEARWIQSNASAVTWEGKPAILAFLQDLSALRQTEKALYESEIRFQMIAENTKDMILLSEGLGRIVFVNSALLALLGFTDSELSRRPISDLIQPRFHGHLAKTWKKILAGTTVPPQEIVLLKQDGTPLDAEISCFAIEQEEGEAYFGAIMRDITTRKMAEQEIEHYRERLEKLVAERTSELTVANRKLRQTVVEQELAEERLSQEKNKLEALFAAIGDGLSVHDQNFRILFQNSVLTDKYGDCTGRTCHAAYHDRAEPCPGCGLPECFEDGAVHWFEMVEVRGKENMFYELSVSPVRDGKGAIIAAVEVVRDISDQKKMADQLLQAQKMEAIGTLAGGIAHDFNNILTAILGYAELSKLETNPGSDLNNNLSEIIAASRRAGDLIRQILTFSRRSEFKKQPLAIQAVVKEAVKLLRGTIPSTIEIRQRICEECGTILADVTQIHQVIMNLCTNAYHAMQEKGGTLTIGLEQADLRKDSGSLLMGLAPENYVKLSVSDTGHGMDEATLERIFEPYFTTKKKGEGTGLGLATVHGIVENHGGVITVDSKEGEGTSFTIYFPTVDKPAVVFPDQEEIHSLGVEARILFVDDEEMLIRLGERILRKLGFTVTAVSSSRQALETFRADPLAFDLLLTDQVMPGLTGIDLARQCRILRPDLPVILATGYSEVSDKESALAHGIGTVLLKPISIKTMAESIMNALPTKEKERTAP
ncbi:PAS domain-containing hybrid sensor histidine kinase/response regulator [Thiovibrio sp. JS02]